MGQMLRPKSEQFDNQTVMVCPKSERVQISALYFSPDFRQLVCLNGCQTLRILDGPSILNLDSSTTLDRIIYKTKLVTCYKWSSLVPKFERPDFERSKLTGIRTTTSPDFGIFQSSAFHCNGTFKKWRHTARGESHSCSILAWNRGKGFQKKIFKFVWCHFSKSP